MAAGDRASLVFFSTGAEVAVRSTADRGRLLAALASAAVGPGATRFAPALKLGGSLLGESPLPRREVILISDFQRRGWEQTPGRDDVRLPERTVLTPVTVGDGTTTNLSVTPVSLAAHAVRESGPRRRDGAASRITARQPRPACRSRSRWTGDAIQSLPVDVAANGTASVTFAPFTVASRNMRGNDADSRRTTSRATTRSISSCRRPSRSRSFVVGRPRRGARECSISRARSSIGEAPRVDLTARTIDGVSDADLLHASVVIVNDVQVPDDRRDRLARFVERVAAGCSSRRVRTPRGRRKGGRRRCPRFRRRSVDRTTGTPSRLGALEYSHPVFDLFRAPRSGDFSAARFYGYRGVDARTGAGARAVRRRTPA